MSVPSYEHKTDWLQESYQSMLSEIADLKRVLQSLCQSGSAPAGYENIRYLSVLKDTAADSVLLNRICELFALSAFERRLILMCLATELDPEIARLYQQLNGKPLPNMDVALRLGDGHCGVLAPQAPLRLFQLLNIENDTPVLLQRSLVLNEWLLFYLTGTPIIDSSVSAVLERIDTERSSLSDGTTQQVESLSRILTSGRVQQTALQLQAGSFAETVECVAGLARIERCEVFRFSLFHLPATTQEQEHMLQLIERELIARQALCLLDCQRLFEQQTHASERHVLSRWLVRLIQDLPGACILCGTEKIQLTGVTVYYHTVELPDRERQRQLWHGHLYERLNLKTHANINDPVDDAIQSISTQYRFSAEQVEMIARRVAMEVHTEAETYSPVSLPQKLWSHSREQAQQHLHGLAQIITPRPLDWNDLILPEREKQNLQAIVAQAQQRHKVYQQWQFAGPGAYGLGICALFCGSSGTGKTMAARVLASVLNVDLYHIDLSVVIDKYIGETEKKLDAIFRAAENSGAVLLFDEADALFGKRSQVQEAKDRYANMGVSFLLQRMEAYAGISILTTNLRSAMDTAFTRRLRFIIPFPFPTAVERKQLWQSMLPAAAPKQDIDYDKLARLSLAGGSIRNITLHAAFVAANEEQAISMQHLLTAARQEYLKTEKALDESLVQDW
ncbi:ATP-binding protein [Gynuella sunshinyii]|uniref:ATPase of the AAA+ class n=1 Tax=Gynuella sunshinyii YC6258 TaxID=1445510 RepID=A0A0C5VIT3_9GAMM|nr:ATP-binding protein [Gynuella sunshinyii]AJQ93238.1 ATPase of the AAA+ class [Gynuella sunshinyii YC6258]